MAKATPKSSCSCVNLCRPPLISCVTWGGESVQAGGDDGWAVTSPLSSSRSLGQTCRQLTGGEPKCGTEEASRQQWTARTRGILSGMSWHIIEYRELSHRNMDKVVETKELFEIADRF